MKILLASIVLIAFACTQANSFQNPAHLTKLHKLAVVGGLKNGKRDLWPKISGGKEATPGQFPYQAGLKIDDSYFCGGAIIHESYVLTAAKCVNSGRTFAVYVGDIKLDINESPRQSLISHDAIIYDDYDPNSFYGDIALIHLPEPLTFGDNINKIRLPPPEGRYYKDGATITGWGSRLSGGLLSPTLLYAEVNLLATDYCKKWYGDWVIDTLICADPQYHFEGNCDGDTGGPIVARYMVDCCSYVNALAGVNVLANCGHGPNAYTSVRSYLDWINYYIEG